MKTDVRDIVRGHDPRVIVGCDTPILTHTSGVCIADVTAVDVGYKIKRSDPVADQ